MQSTLIRTLLCIRFAVSAQLCFSRFRLHGIFFTGVLLVLFKTAIFYSTILRYDSECTFSVSKGDIKNEY